jgi:hypothetical protein
MFILLFNTLSYDYLIEIAEVCTSNDDCLN